MGFGEKVRIDNPIRELLMKAPRLRSTDTTLLMRDRYETTYGIYNHDAPEHDRRLALVGMHPKEDATRYSLLRERIREFGKREIHKFTGMSMDAFFQLPPDVCAMVFEEAAELAKENGKMQDDVLNDMKGK